MAELRFLPAIAPDTADALFFAGDLGQRIFQQPFSWKELGIDVRGRPSTLTVNYRTSHQVHRMADRLLPTKVRDVDGNADARDRTVSIFNGPPPEILKLPDEGQEIAAVTAWMEERMRDGVRAEEVGVFVRTRAQLARVRDAVQAAGLECVELSDRDVDAGGRVLVGTMHLAKGLEVKAAIVMACDDRVLPLKERLETAADETELDGIRDGASLVLRGMHTRPRSLADKCG